MNIWLKNRENIVFETTGYNNFDWLFKYTFLSDPQVRNDYKIVIVYPYVEKNIILVRALFRFYTRIKDLILYANFNDNDLNINELTNNIKNSNKINGKILRVPRLPILFDGPFSLNESVNVIQKTLADYIINCDNIIMYNNLEESPQLLFDARKSYYWSDYF